MAFDVISPDGFSIRFDRTYKTIEEAKHDFDEWKKAFEPQGYYSSTQYGRIPLNELEHYCKIIEIKE